MGTQQLLRKTRQIIVDGDRLCRQDASRWHGLGMVIGNGTTHLLTDYAWKHPQTYEEVLRLLFLPGYGACLNHLAVELGNDINGEPCTKRSSNEPADVRECAAFRIAKDALRINPALTLELRVGSDPAWVAHAFSSGSESGCIARYKWLRETLQSAFEVYDLRFSYVTPIGSDEGEPDTVWLLYAATHLRSDKTLPYPADQIRIVAPDIVKELMASKSLRSAIDVIERSSTIGDDNTRLLHDEYGKEIWYTQGAAPANEPSLTCRIDKCGMTGRGGAVDIANRILGGFPNGQITMYSFRSALRACYGADIPGSLITANEPWSGHIEPQIGLWTARHFTKFTDPGWLFAEGACYRDGSENRSVRHTEHAYLTLCEPDGKGLTMILTNDSDVPRSYLVVLKNLPALPEYAYLIETIGNNDPWLVDVDWFKATEKVKLSGLDNEIAFPVVVKPNSIMTITTEAGRFSHVYGDEELDGENPERTRLLLPFAAEFTHDPLNPCNKPLYLDDVSGCFRIVTQGEKSWLEQQAEAGDAEDEDLPDPFTCFGDDMWANYQAATEAEFAEVSPDNYVGIGIRNNASDDCSGLQMLLYADGQWELWQQDEILQSGTVPEFRADGRHKLGISALGTLVMCFADGHSLCELKLDGRPFLRDGRACLSSAFFRNRFYALTAQDVGLPIPIMKYIYRVDCLSQYVKFDENAETGWRLQGMADARNFSRTCAEGVTGAALEIRFYGTGIYLLGQTEYAQCRLFLDDALYSEKHEINDCDFREVFLAIEPLKADWHTLRIEILDGKLCFDAFEIPTNDIPPDYDTNFPADPEHSDSLISRRMSGFDVRKAAIPLAGAAATGLAVAFTLGKLSSKLQSIQKKRKKNS